MHDRSDLRTAIAFGECRVDGGGFEPHLRADKSERYKNADDADENGDERRDRRPVTELATDRVIQRMQDYRKRAREDKRGKERFKNIKGKDNRATQKGEEKIMTDRARAHEE